MNETVRDQGHPVDGCTQCCSAHLGFQLLPTADGCKGALTADALSRDFPFFCRFTVQRAPQPQT